MTLSHFRSDLSIEQMYIHIYCSQRDVTVWTYASHCAVGLRERGHNAGPALIPQVVRSLLRPVYSLPAIAATMNAAFRLGAGWG